MAHTNCWKGRAIVAFGILTVLAAASARAQSARGLESAVGGEWELYARALAGRGLLHGQPWSSRPFAPSVLETWADSLKTPHPWADALNRDGRRSVSILRPSLNVSYNSGLPWGLQDGAVWQGRGATVWGSAGALWRGGPFSVRLEPMFSYAQNRAFTLLRNANGSVYGSALEAGFIDVPQRFGDKAYAFVDPGQSFARIDIAHVAAGFSTENLFWGPGLKNALLFDANAAGFPHVFLGTSDAVRTPVGSVYGRIIYGRLEQSEFSAASASRSRLGAGAIAVWMPHGDVFELGVARFYHHRWTGQLGRDELLSPFGSFRHDAQVANKTTDAPDNQLASAFATVRVPRAGLEIFGEFGRNDRPGSFRDLELEPEHNSAWLLGFLQTLNWSERSFWTLRAEAANGRIAALQDLGRGQSTFYDHGRLTQGHTERGQVLGTPLIEASSGMNVAIDRWGKTGRLGAELFERQMPDTLATGFGSRAGARSQWDLSASMTRFVGGTDLSLAVGHVWDIHRFEGRDAHNAYVRVGIRPSIGR
jgi:hypothetical protein